MLREILVRRHERFLSSLRYDMGDSSGWRCGAVPPARTLRFSVRWRLQQLWGRVGALGRAWEPKERAGSREQGAEEDLAAGGGGCGVGEMGRI
jgi:hypothetical protein